MKKFIVIGAFLFVFSEAAQAAVVYFKDGGKVTGTIVSSTAQSIDLHTPNGTVTIGTDRISRVVYDETPSAAPAAPPPLPVEQTAPPVSYAPYRRRMIPEQSFDDQRQLFSLGFGVSAPLSRVDFTPTGGGTDNNGDAGFLFSTQYIYGLTPHWGVGGTVEFAHRSNTRSQSLLPFSNTDVYGNSAVMLGTLKYSIVTHGYARPYLLGGLGAHHTSTTIEARPDRGFGWSDTDTDETRTLVDDSHWGFASTARIGVDFSWLDPSVFTLEFGWTHLDGPSYTATPAGQDLGLSSVTGNQNDFVFAARWGWKF